MSKDVFLDMKGACFLCLQEPVSDIENVMSEVSLQTICRCLNINPTSFPWKEFPPNKKRDISVIMCSTCSSTTHKLTDLINQIEMINNLLTYQLQVFHRTINSSDGNPESADSLQIMKESPAMKEHVDLVKRLRTAIKEKCSKKIKQIEANNYPKVLLERLGPKPEILQDEAQIQIKQPVDDEDDCCATTLIKNRFDPPTRSDIPIKLSQPPQDISSIISPNQLEDNSNPSFPKGMLSSLCRKYSTQTGNEYLCSICDYVFPQGLKRIRFHLVNCHPEKIFISQTAYHLDDLKLRDLNKRLFSIEIQQAKERGGIINGKQCFPCELCNRKYFSHSNFKYHLLIEHFRIMETRLNHLITALPSNQTKSKKVWICSGESGCGHRFRTSSNLRRHLAANICERNKTQKLKLLEAIQSQSDDPPATFIVPDLMVEGTIPNCETKAVNNPKRKLKTCSEEDGGCGKIFLGKSSLINHKKYHCPSLGRWHRWTCDVRDGGCGDTFSNKFVLQRHQKNICSKKKKKEVEYTREVSCQNGNAEPEDNFNVEMECSVENVEISKYEVVDTQDESEVEFENIEEFETDPLQL